MISEFSFLVFQRNENQLKFIAIFRNFMEFEDLCKVCMVQNF